MARHYKYKYELEYQEEDVNGFDHWVMIEFNDVDDWNIQNEDDLDMHFDLYSDDFVECIQDSIRDYLQELPNAEACKAYDDFN